MVQRLRAVTRLHLAPHPHAARHPFDAPQNALKPPRPEQPRELALVRLVHVPGHVAQQAGFPHFAQGEALPGWLQVEVSVKRILEHVVARSVRFVRGRLHAFEFFGQPRRRAAAVQVQGLGP